MISIWQIRSSIVGIILLFVLACLLSCTPLSQEEKDYRAAKNEDWYSAYEDYIKKYPNGTNVQKAMERIAWLKANKAVVEVDYPKEVEATTSPYRNVESPFWPLTITFKEKGGKTGYKLTEGPDYYRASGGAWCGYGGKTVKVRPCGETREISWWSSVSHNLCNGTREVTWSGEDAGGNPISIEVVVKSLHKGCTGPKK